MDMVDADEYASAEALRAELEQELERELERALDEELEVKEKLTARKG